MQVVDKSSLPEELSDSASDCDEEEETNFSVIEKCTELRSTELELLQSMFSDNELRFIALSEKDLQKLGFLSSTEFVLKIVSEISALAKTSDIEMAFQLSPYYPLLRYPSVFVRSEALSKEKSCQLNSELRKYMMEALPLGEPMLTEVVQWTRDNFKDFANSLDSPKNETKIKMQGPEKFSRVWFYAHHINSSTKRRNIISLAQERKFTGFSLPGKPGIICIEGSSEDCKEYWDLIRAWNWKKLVIRHRDDVEIASKGSLADCGKFGPFREMCFRTKQEPGRSMDMGLFLEFLKEHDSGHVFQIIFGLEGK